MLAEILNFQGAKPIWGMGSLSNLIYMLYAPYDEYFYAEERKNEKKIAKYKSIVCSNFALIIGHLCETKYLNIAIIILLEQGGLIIHREKGDRNE